MSGWTNYRVRQSFTEEEKRLCQNGNGKNRRLGCLDMYSSFLKHVITKSTRYQSPLHLPHELFYQLIVHHASSKGVKTFSTSLGNYIMKEMYGICPFPNNPECFQIFWTPLMFCSVRFRCKFLLGCQRPRPFKHAFLRLPFLWLFSLLFPMISSFYSRFDKLWSAMCLRMDRS